MAYDQPDPFRKILNQLTKPSDVPNAFVAVPLVGRTTGPIGALVVDNRFLWSERTIDNEDIVGLEAFAGVLGFSLENAHLRQELTRKQRLENWKEVTAAIAHTMGTLLFGLEGNIQIIREQLQDLAPEVQEHLTSALSTLSDGISRADKILRDFRMFVRPATVERTIVDFRDIVNEVFSGSLSECLISVSLPQSPVMLSADPGAIGTALRELKKNAEEALASSSVEPKIIEVTADVSSSQDGSHFYCDLRIEDNGPGIPDDIRPRLFQPYFTTKSAGTGLGLSIAHKIITAHDGSVQATDRDGGGTRFSIRLPILSTDEVAPHA